MWNACIQYGSCNVELVHSVWVQVIWNACIHYGWVQVMWNYTYTLSGRTKTRVRPQVAAASLRIVALIYTVYVELRGSPSFLTHYPPHYV